MHIYRRTGSYNATLVERHGFQEKTAYCVRIPGGILTLFNPQTHLKKSGTAFSDFSVFWRCVHYFSVIFIILKMCFIDFSLFWRWFSLFWRWFSLFFHGFHDFKKFLIIVNYCSLIFHYCSLIFHYFQDVAHYFHGCFIIFKMCFIIFHWFFNVVACVSLIFQCFKGVLHDFSLCFGFFCNLHAYSAYLQCHIHGRHGKVENALRILEF